MRSIRAEAARAGFAAAAAATVCVAVGAFAAMPVLAQPAQAWPVKPVRVIVPFAPGGGSDIIARQVSFKLQEQYRQAFVIENRGGAGGLIGMELLAKAPADGYSIIIMSGSFSTSAALQKPAFDPIRTIRGVAEIGYVPFVLAVHPSLPVKTMPEFFRLARNRPGELCYASSGIGGSLHLAAELLKRRAGFEITHVAFKGAGPAIAAVLGGEPPMMVGAVPSTIGHVASGKLRALATTGPKRHKVTPDLPTVAELGYPGFENVAWLGLFLPARTPTTIVDRVRAEAIRALDAPEVQGTMAKLGLDRETSTPSELAARMRAEIVQLAAVIKAAGIKGE